MRSIISFIIVAFTFVFISCEKELSYENPITPVSAGTLNAGPGGDCQPSQVNGIFRQGMLLDETNYVDIEVEVFAIGDYIITTDTINGYYFNASGFFSTPGVHTVRLQGGGTPDIAITNRLTISYSGTTCTVDVMVIDASTPPAVIAFETGGGGECSGAVSNGVFTAGTTLAAGNSVTLVVDVISTGTFMISTPVTNGMTFSAIGVFSSTGLQTVTLNGSGTPTNAGATNIQVTSGASSCAFTISVAPSGPTGGQAVYALGGNGSTCTGSVITGNYNEGLATTSSNTVKIDVNVSAAGTYSITTNNNNGVVFTGAGSFASTGAQQVTLTASGTPAAAGDFTYAVTGATSNCNFSITYLPPVSPAVFTLAGAPGACATPQINGGYTQNIPTNSTNTVVIKVDVTTAGSYTITTNSANGITFSGSGIFPSTGTGIDVILTASGTPTAAGVNTFTPQAGTSSCTFDITTTSAPDGVFSGKIDGVAFSFHFDAVASYEDIPGFNNTLMMEGYTAPTGGGGNIPRFGIYISKLDASDVQPGSYNVDGLTNPNPYRIEIDYDEVDAGQNVTLWNTSSTIIPPANPPFTVVITSITATRVKGTFSGKLTNTLQGSTLQKTVTEGVFDLPLQ